MDENPENAAKKPAHSEFYANNDENPERALALPTPIQDPLRIMTKIRKTPPEGRRFPDFRLPNRSRGGARSKIVEEPESWRGPLEDR
jgi:hypothetical protein